MFPYVGSPARAVVLCVGCLMQKTMEPSTLYSDGLTGSRIHLRTQNNRFTLIIGFVGKVVTLAGQVNSGKRINKTRVTVGVSLQAQTPDPIIPSCQRCTFDFYQSQSGAALIKNKSWVRTVQEIQENGTYTNKPAPQKPLFI